MTKVYLLKLNKCSKADVGLCYMVCRKLSLISFDITFIQRAARQYLLETCSVLSDNNRPTKWFNCGSVMKIWDNRPTWNLRVGSGRLHENLVQRKLWSGITTKQNDQQNEKYEKSRIEFNVMKLSTWRISDCLMFNAFQSPLTRFRHCSSCFFVSLQLN